MKRDMDLVRSLLILMDERDDAGVMPAGQITLEGRDEREIQYHLNLMYQAGFINGEPVRSTTSDRLISVYPFDLTWAGHEFLDTIRDPEIWRKAKAGATKAGSASVEFIWAMARTMITSAIKDRTGLDLIP